MELSPKQQTTELIKKSKKILIAGRRNPDGDTVGSILALTSILSSLEKEVTAVVSAEISEIYKFLPEIEKIKPELEGTKDFVIKLDAKDNPVKKVLWSEKEGTVEIIITPTTETYSEEKVSFKKGSYDFDLIIILDTPDVESIDDIYDKLSEIFFEKPVVNIDHHAGNEFFGTINLVDANATSTAEILVSIIEALGSNLLDEKVATNLLAGIIYDTESFKNKKTTPKSLTVSAQLLAAGAKKQEIINSFYQTRSVDTLKLYGKILSNLNYDQKAKLLWSVVYNNDFKNSGMTLEVMQDTLDDLLGTTPEADTVLLLIEKEKGDYVGKLKGLRGADVLSLAEIFKGKGSFHLAEFEVESVNDIEKEVVEKIAEKIKFRLGVHNENIRHVFVPLQKLDKDRLKREDPTQEEESEIKEEPKVEEKPKEEKQEQDEKAAMDEIREIIEEDKFTELAAKEQVKLDDAISEAIKSIDETTEQKPDETVKPNVQEKPMSSIGEVLKQKGYEEPVDEDYEEEEEDEDPFYDDEEIYESENEITHTEDDSEPEIREWREE